MHDLTQEVSLNSTGLKYWKSPRLFVVFWMKQNGKRLYFISSKAQRSQWSWCVTNGISHSLPLFWWARLSWENNWWGKASPPARPAHWQLTHCTGLARFVFLHREMNVFWWRDERMCAEYYNTACSRSVDSAQNIATTHGHGKVASLRLVPMFSFMMITKMMFIFKYIIWMHQCFGQ